MSKTAEVQKQEYAYSQASQLYWEKLYQAVRQETEDYNARKKLAPLSVGELGEGLNAKEFTVRHSRTESITAVNRSTESFLHTMDITCEVVGTHRMELRLTAEGQIETVCTAEPEIGTTNVNTLKTPKTLTLVEIVKLIVNPLKEHD